MFYRRKLPHLQRDFKRLSGEAKRAEGHAQ
jgi:hypothetical protein